MLSEIAATVFSLFHVLGLCSMLIGVLYLLTTMLGGRGPDGYIKAVAFILIGGWIGHLGQTERSPTLPGRARHAQFLMMAAPDGPRLAEGNSQPVAARALKI
jgi:hypothetical protein